jgi:amidohydrolase
MTARLRALDFERMVTDRRTLHAHPELAYEEVRTAGLVRERLERLGYEVRTGVGKTGVLGWRTGDHAERGVLLRADMDALPIREQNDVAYRSTVDGVMHACGHDGHVAVGLAVAERLSNVPLAGTLKFAFQPAEEGRMGAEAMINDGALLNPPVTAAFGMHLWSYLPVGTIAIRPGPVFASADHFEIMIHGRGGHAAIPQDAVDPVAIAAHLVTALHTLIGRARDPLEEAVLSITAITTPESFNVIPDHAKLMGTVRTFGGEFHRDVEQLMRRAIDDITHAFGATGQLTFNRLMPPMVNDVEMSHLMETVAREVVGAIHVRGDVRTMGAEDMACFLNAVPGCYALVGCGNEGPACHPHHSPHFDIDEGALRIAAELLSRTALRYLDQPAS